MTKPVAKRPVNYTVLTAPTRSPEDLRNLALLIAGQKKAPLNLENDIESCAVSIFERHQRQLKSPSLEAARRRLLKISSLCKQLNQQFGDMGEDEIDALRYISGLFASEDLWDPDLNSDGSIKTMRSVRGGNTRQSTGPEDLLNLLFKNSRYFPRLLAEFAQTAIEAEASIVKISKSVKGRANLSERIMTSVDYLIHHSAIFLASVGRAEEIKGTKGRNSPLMAVSAALWTYATGLEEPATLEDRITYLAPGRYLSFAKGRWFEKPRR